MISYKTIFSFGLLGLAAVILITLGVGLKAYLMNFKGEHPQPAQALALTRHVTQATGPLRVNPANPRYFTDDSGRAIYLTGSHTWANFQDAGAADPPPIFAYDQYLDFLETHHHNFIRLWSWEQAKGAPWTTDGIWFNPSIYQRPGPGTALDGKPKFDLTQFDQAYFDRLRARVIQAGERGIYVSIMLFDGWSIDRKDDAPGNPWPGHPYHGQNNINGIDGDANFNGAGEEIHTLQIANVTALQETYVRKVIDSVNDLDNVLYEISNESPANSQDWQYHMINSIKEYESSLVKQHPVGMTVEYPGGDNTKLFNSPADWISPNDNGDYKNNPPVADGSKVILVDTDHLWGVGGDRQWVWKSFTRGANPIYMDCYAALFCDNLDPNDPTLLSTRRNMGATLIYAQRMNLVAMSPRPDLCSTKYCLAHATADTGEYLVYLPVGNSVTVDLSATQGELNIEWFNPETGVTTAAEVVAGGANRSFTPPFSGDAVLYLYQTVAEPQFRLFLPVVGQGKVLADPPGPYTSSQQVALYAFPVDGWKFTAWDGDVTGITNPLTLTITQDTIITATFQQPPLSPYTVTVRTVGNGTVAFSTVGPFSEWQPLQITAHPDPSWNFSGWGGALAGYPNPFTTTITSNATISATFVTNQSFIPTAISQ